MFDPDYCAVPSLWCGDNDMPTRITNDKKYTGKGTRAYCMKKGYGAGMYAERAKSLPPSSLKNIKYIGDEYEKKFMVYKINTIQDLKQRGKNPKSLDKILLIVFTKSDGVLDKRGYNSVLLYLYRNGTSNLPSCKKEW